MTVMVTGRRELEQYIVQVKAALTGPLMRGAARAGGGVVAREAQEKCSSAEVAAGVKVRVKGDQDIAIARIIPTKAKHIANWLEYGTSPHFISVDDSQSGGRSVRRINQLERGGSLVIGGNFVGATVHHPGARPYPFLRPALDTKESEALRAAQTYIDTRIGGGLAAMAVDDVVEGETN